MRRPHWLLVLAAVPMTLHGQNGVGSSCCSRVTARVQAAQMTLHDDNGGGAPRAASRELGRQYLGGVHANGYHYVEYDEQHLWALDQQFILPRRDSALVVMVDGVDAPGGPRVAGYAYIAAEMPEKYWTKMWTSGDTTFIVHPGNTDGLLLEALRASSAVRAFIETPASR